MKDFCPYLIKQTLGSRLLLMVCCPNQDKLATTLNYLFNVHEEIAIMFNVCIKKRNLTYFKYLRQQKCTTRSNRFTKYGKMSDFQQSQGLYNIVIKSCRCCTNLYFKLTHKHLSFRNVRYRLQFMKFCLYIVHV